MYYTLATVGYGDIVPKTNPQTMYTMVVMLLGVGVYGYVIGNVTNLWPTSIWLRATTVKIWSVWLLSCGIATFLPRCNAV